jgi:hypothetical protein
MPKDNALDLKFAYTVEEAYLLLGQLNQDQREFYSVGVWVLDLPYMLVYTLLFAGILYRLWDRKGVMWLPIYVLLADFCENIYILKILHNYPSHLADSVVIASILTTAKWIFVVMVLLVIIGGFMNRYFQTNFSSDRSKEINA